MNNLVDLLTHRVVLYCVLQIYNSILFFLFLTHFFLFLNRVRVLGIKYVEGGQESLLSFKKNQIKMYVPVRRGGRSSFNKLAKLVGR